MGFVNRMDQNVAKYRISSWMVDAWVLYCIKIDEGDESLSLLDFWRGVVNKIFLKYSKEDRSSSSHAGIWNVLADIYYDGAKHYQVPSEKQGRCKVSKTYSRRRCKKCKVNLHDVCFEIFHAY